MRRPIYSQGEDGELLFGISTEIETTGVSTSINLSLKEIIQECSKVAQYNRAVLAVLLIYTAGIARSKIEYGVENGLDVWRRLCYHCMCLADDLQQLLIRE